MLDDNDFDLPDFEPTPEGTTPSEAEPTPASTASRPVVIVEYRRHRLLHDLSPPVLLLLVAALVFTYRERIEDWPGLFAFPLRSGINAAARLPADAGPEAIVPPLALTADSPRAPLPSTATEPENVAQVAEPQAAEDKPIEVAEAGPDPIAPLAPELEPIVEPEPPAIEADQPTPEAPRSFPAIGFDRPEPEDDLALAEVVAPIPRAEPEPVSGEEVWAAIRREAELRQAEQERLRRLTPLLIEQERRQAERKQREEMEEVRRSIRRDRAKFHAELRLILRQPIPTAIPEIERLCERFGRMTPPEAEAKTRRMLNERGVYLGRSTRVQMLRECGLPESRILDYLANTESRNILARDGPRDHEEALLRAAMQLVDVPPRGLETPPTPSRPGAEARIHTPLAPIPAHRLRFE